MVVVPYDIGYRGGRGIIAVQVWLTTADSN